MGTAHHRTSENLKKSDAKPEDVRIAYRLLLPYRFRVGSSYKIELLDKVSNRQVTLYFRNRVSVPNGTPSEALSQMSYELDRRIEDSINQQKDKIPVFVIEALCSQFNHLKSTEALIVLDSKGATLNNFEEWKNSEVQCLLHQDDVSLIGCRALNRFIVAYSQHKPHSFIVPQFPLRTISQIEFDRYVSSYCEIIAPSAYELNEQNIEAIFNECAEDFIVDRFVSLEPDLESDAINQIPTTLSEQSESLYHEFAFQAESYMTESNEAMGLLMIVVALEGAHSKFVSIALADKLSDGAKKKGEVINNYLRDQGFHTLSQITPYLFMDSHERPSAEAINQSLKGIEIRNAIMHLIRDTKGNYKSEKYTETDLREAYKGVYTVYNHYVNAIDNRLSTTATSLDNTDSTKPPKS